MAPLTSHPPDPPPHTTYLVNTIDTKRTLKLCGHAICLCNIPRSTFSMKIYHSPIMCQGYGAMMALAGEWDSETGASASHFSSSAVRWLPIGANNTCNHLFPSPP